MDKKFDALNKVIDRQEQYSRRNCILLHGVKESEYDTDTVVTETLNELLQEKLTDIDIDRSHRIGRLKKGKQSRPIIIKFARYNIRNIVFKKKKKLKDTGVSITESLTQKRMQMLTKARNEFLFKNVWTQDGKMFIMFNTSFGNIFNRIRRRKLCWRIIFTWVILFFIIYYLFILLNTPDISYVLGLTMYIIFETFKSYYFLNSLILSLKVSYLSHLLK